MFNRAATGKVAEIRDGWLASKVQNPRARMASGEVSKPKICPRRKSQSPRSKFQTNAKGQNSKVVYVCAELASFRDLEFEHCWSLGFGNWDFISRLCVGSAAVAVNDRRS